MELIYAVCSSVLGYFTMRATSHPNSKVQRKLPCVTVKNLQILPNVRITIKGRVIQLHHWLQFTILLCVSVFITSPFLDSPITRGFLLGGIIQGLQYPDRGILKKSLK